MENYKFLINGNKKLFGSVSIDSSKNAILPILAASIMCKNKVVLNGITYYEDVISMINILKHIGVVVEQYENLLILDASKISRFDIPLDLTNKLRASIFLLGPLLSKFKKARVAYPGGCDIGTRPIDIHISGLTKLGSNVIDRHGIINVNGQNLKAGQVFLPFPSVGATENLIMASVFLKGQTTLYGTAKEPEVVDLCSFLNKMGAKIYGAGTDTITIIGVKELFGGEYSPIADRIALGTYMLAPLVCGGEVEYTNVNCAHVKPVLDLLANNTCKIYSQGDKIVVSSKQRLNGFGKIETLPYPFFPTDLQQPFCTLASVANGNTIMVENLFENRFKHVFELNKMGAKIVVKNKTAFIEGVPELFGASVEAPDLRGGASLVLAGLVANGYTTISNIKLIERGYFNMHVKLEALGADIKKVT